MVVWGSSSKSVEKYDLKKIAYFAYSLHDLTVFLSSKSKPKIVSQFRLTMRYSFENYIQNPDYCVLFLNVGKNYC